MDEEECSVRGLFFIAAQFNAKGKLISAKMYRNVYLFGLMGVIPEALFFLIPEPMNLLQSAGIVKAINIPGVAFSVMYLNLKTRPEELKPSKFMTVLTLLLPYSLYSSPAFIYEESL
jgi:hypothetical protein